jgi:acyl-coenzyme A synthetase/AMP-(fatty) acid ligase
MKSKNERERDMGRCGFGLNANCPGEPAVAKPYTCGMETERFSWNVPPAFNFGRDVVDVLGREDRLGLLFVDAAGARTDLGFPAVAAATQRWAGMFRDLGITKGERVVVLLPKVPAWLYAMVALGRLGAVIVPCSEQLRAKDLGFRARHSEATTIVAHVSNRAEVDLLRDDAPGLTRYLLVGSESDVPGWTSLDALVDSAERFAGNPTASQDPAYIVYTSGTTKDPKGVVHNHGYTFAKRMQAQVWLDAKPSDLVWSTAGTGWAKSLWNVLLGPWSCGSAIVLDEGAFDPAKRMDAIRDLGVTVLCQAPTEYRLEAKLEGLGERWKLPALRHCVSAGEPLNPEVLARWKEAFGLTILDGYGQTENSLLVANVPGMDVRPGSMGKPTPGHDIDVVDAEGRPCPPGEVGDIGVRGDPPTLFRGYYKNDEETRASRRGEWYLTGDRAQKDDDGYFWFVGRSDDVISSGAYRIGPFEVESALLEHPAVLESAVVGSPDPDRGNVVKAFVVLRAGREPSAELVRELQDHCKRVTAPYKYPREIEFVAELPKTRSGKIRRVELRAAELAKKGATAASGFV